MGMTIDESLLYMELYKRKLLNSVSDLHKDIEAYDLAIETMRKYQTIQDIAENYDKGILEENDGIYAFKQIRKVLEVVEDGKID